MKTKNTKSAAAATLATAPIDTGAMAEIASLKNKIASLETALAESNAKLANAGATIVKIAGFELPVDTINKQLEIFASDAGRARQIASENGLGRDVLDVTLGKTKVPDLSILPTLFKAKAFGPIETPEERQKAQRRVDRIKGAHSLFRGLKLLLALQ